MDGPDDAALAAAWCRKPAPSGLARLLNRHKLRWVTVSVSGARWWRYAHGGGAGAAPDALLGYAPACCLRSVSTRGQTLTLTVAPCPAHARLREWSLLTDEDDEDAADEPAPSPWPLADEAPLPRRRLLTLTPLSAFDHLALLSALAIAGVASSAVAPAAAAAAPAAPPPAPPPSSPVLMLHPPFGLPSLELRLSPGAHAAGKRARERDVLEAVCAHWRQPPGEVGRSPPQQLLLVRASRAASPAEARVAAALAQLGCDRLALQPLFPLAAAAVGRRAAGGGGGGAAPGSAPAGGWVTQPLDDVILLSRPTWIDRSLAEQLNCLVDVCPHRRHHQQQLLAPGSGELLSDAPPLLSRPASPGGSSGTPRAGSPPPGGGGGGSAAAAAATTASAGHFHLLLVPCTWVPPYSVRLLPAPVSTTDCYGKQLTAHTAQLTLGQGLFGRGATVWAVTLRRRDVARLVVMLAQLARQQQQQQQQQRQQRQQPAAHPAPAAAAPLQAAHLLRPTAELSPPLHDCVPEWRHPGKLFRVRRGYHVSSSAALAQGGAPPPAQQLGRKQRREAAAAGGAGGAPPPLGAEPPAPLPPRPPPRPHELLVMMLDNPLARGSGRAPSSFGAIFAAHDYAVSLERAVRRAGAGGGGGSGGGAGAGASDAGQRGSSSLPLAGRREDGMHDDDDDDEDEEEEEELVEKGTARVSFTEARRAHLERCVQQALAIAQTWHHPRLLEWLGLAQSAQPPTWSYAALRHTLKSTGFLSSGRGGLGTTPPPTPASHLPGATLRALPMSQLLACVRPGDVILFSCANAPSALQRRLARCDFDHVGIVVDDAWRETLALDNRACRLEEREAVVGALDGGGDEVAGGGTGVRQAGGHAHPRDARRSAGGGAASDPPRRASAAAARFFGVSDDEASAAAANEQGRLCSSEEVRDEQQLPQPAPACTGSAEAASSLGGRHEGGASDGASDEAGDSGGFVATARLSQQPPFESSQPQQTRGAPASAPHRRLHALEPLLEAYARHAYSLQLLEATGEGVRVYPLAGRMAAYGDEYTSVIAIRRLLLPGEEEDAGSGGGGCGRAGCSATTRPGGAAPSPDHRAVASAAVAAAAAAPFCRCLAAQRLRLAVERRLAGFMTEVQGLRYSLGAAKLLLRPPSHLVALPPGVARARARAQLDPSGAATRALAAGVPARPHYYCSELLAAAWQRCGLLPLRRDGGGVPLAHTDASAFWPNAWVPGGPVEALLPGGARLAAPVLLDPRPPLPVAFLD